MRAESPRSHSIKKFDLVVEISPWSVADSVTAPKNGRDGSHSSDDRSADIRSASACTSVDTPLRAIQSAICSRQGVSIGLLQPTAAAAAHANEFLECRDDIFAAAKLSLRHTTVEFRTADIVPATAERELDFVSLPDVPSFLEETRASSILEDLRLALNPGATVVMRGHLRVIRPRSEGYRDEAAAHSALLAAETTGLCNVS